MKQSAILWMFKCIRKHIPSLVLMVTVNIIHALFWVLFALGTQTVIDSALSGKQDAFITAILHQGFISIVIIVTLALFRQLKERLNATLDRSWKQYILHILFHAEYAVVSEYHSGELHNRLSNDIRIMNDGLLSALPNLASLLMRLTAAIAVLVNTLAKKHSMAAATYYGIEKLLDSQNTVNFELDADLLTNWQQARDMAIRKNIMLDFAREHIFAYMDENNIWHMPLKGSILKDLYPRPGMRQMADNDILVDAQYREQIFRHMVSLGYEGKYQDIGAHDTFYKKPIYNFEIHHTLVSKEVGPVFEKYYRNIKEKLIEEKNCKYRFTDEDFYIYMMVHAYKHHSNSGNGIRHLMDIQVFLNHVPPMNWNYIQKELHSLGISEYESLTRSVSQKLFNSMCHSPQELSSILTQKDIELLSICIHSGSYGTTEVRIKNDLKRFVQGNPLIATRKLAYLWHRLTCEAGLRRDFPILVKIKLLHPFLYVARAIKIFVFRNKIFTKYMRTIFKISKLD